MAELVTVAAQNVVRGPNLSPALTWAEAAAFSLVTLTAWRMLVTRAQIKPGETALIWGIGGGGSLTAKRLANLLRARGVLKASGGPQLAAVEQVGAAGNLNHHTQKVATEGGALTNQPGRA